MSGGLKFAAKAASQAPRRSESPPPAGAQGDVPIIEWIVQIASDPAMAKVYVNGFIFAINEIVQAVRTKEKKGKKKPKEKRKGTSETDTSDEPLKVRIRVFGKEVILPTATAALKTILENLGDQ